ncbi:uncharacterized protein ARMOST_15887 [Armillaria ostoyae]|uniref:Uncharacterized protein n=1 Tax=Armillaria ostoyae TaxID=47428 RepID=A0A284RUP7_ARMOS|nr:uncharacterized protein ARMOST_15887 [Armillaria ostoyae]
MNTRICCGERDVFVVLDSDEIRIVSERGGNTRETGSIGEHFTVLPNSCDVDASGSRFCAEPSIIRIRKGCRDAGRRATTDALAMLNILPFCVRASEPRAANNVNIRQQRVQAGGGIEGDGDDRGDSDEDAPYSLSLDNSSSTRSPPPTFFEQVEQEKAAPEKG